MRLARIIREATIEAFFVAEAKARRWLALKFVSPNYAGVPDRIVFKGIDDAVTHIMLWQGVTKQAAETNVRALLAMCVEFVEMKRPGEKPTLRQMRVHEKLRALGFTVSVVDSRDSAESWYADRS